MKRTIIAILAVTLTVVGILLLGSVFQIGGKLGELTLPVVEYAFYAAVLAVVVAFIIVPVIKVQTAPEMPPLSTEGMLKAEELSRLGAALARNCGYIHDDAARKEHRNSFTAELAACGDDADKLSEIVGGEISYRLKGDDDRSAGGAVIGINRRITDWAKTVFLVTAISQNSKVDSIAVIALNYKMIADIVLASGFRPTRPQMFRLYSRVLATSLLSYIASDALGEITSDVSDWSSGFDLSETPDGADIANGGEGRFIDHVRRLKLPGIVLGSALDGAINALMTLRIGYVTRSYILQGSKALADKAMRRTIRRRAIVDAHKNIPGVIMSAAGVIGKGAAGRLVKIFAR